MTDTRPLVLVVDDDAEILADYLRSLQSVEYRLLGVQRVAQAFKALESQPVDVVITDLQFREADDGGMQVIQKARALDATVAVIMVTAVGRKAEAERAILELGAHAFLRKPLDTRQCRKLILDAILERRKRLASIAAADHGEFMLMQNPYVPGKPLRPRSLLFYGRDEIFDFLRGHLCETPHAEALAVLGPRRIGKTSLLKQLPIRLNADVSPVYVDCQSFGMDPGMPAFFVRLADQIRRGLEMLQELDLSALPELEPAMLAKSPAQTFQELFLQPVVRALDGKLLVLCLDEFEAVAEKVQRGRLDMGAMDFFRQMIAAEDGVVCVLSGCRPLDELVPAAWTAAGLLDGFHTIRMGVLPETLARRLIEEPPLVFGVHYTPQAMESLLSEAGCHPYLLQLLCAEMIKIRNEARRNELTEADVKSAVARVVDERRGDFFWATLSPFQQAALIAACQVAHDSTRAAGRFTSAEVDQRLNVLGFEPGDWPVGVGSLMRSLTFQQLLEEEIDADGIHVYRLGFRMLSDWVRRNKSVELVTEALLGRGKPI